MNKTTTSNGPVSPWRKLLMLWVSLGVFLALAILYAATQSPVGADSPECRSIYMFPSYARIKGFDTTHTKFAVKYSLFLYREQGKDRVPDEGYKEHLLDGIPVLFIPGNAGSFKQVRSIASEVSTIFYGNKDDQEYEGKNFDFFAAHFNEDFTAFHGRTMLDQSEYLNDAIRFILSLYSTQPNPPKSVILLGHSMGGVVARVMLTLPNYVEDSVNTIITLAAPHAAAPATFDGDIIRLYAATDEFWRTGLFGSDIESLAHKRLQDVSIISITGGLSDTILPADYTTMKGLIPETHGFTVYTTGIPRVWTPIDHLAIVWCDQLRRIIGSTLFKVVDPSSSTRTKSLQERMSIFRQNLLSGFEEDQTHELGWTDHKPLRLKLKKEQILLEKKSYTLQGSDSKFHLIPIFDTVNPTFSMLSTNLPQIYDTDSLHSSLLLCKEYPGFTPGQKSLINLGSDEPGVEKSDFECIDISSDVYPVPNSIKPGYELKDSSYGGAQYPLYSMKLTPSKLQNYSYVVYHTAKNASDDDFTRFSLNSTEDLIVESSLSSMLFGSSLTISNISRPLITKITYKGIWSSLLSYRLKADINSPNTKFQPFLRQYIKDPIETKWHLQLSEAKHISFHSVAPYTTFEPGQGDLKIELWTPENSSDATISLKVDILKSLKLLVMRYRLAIASIPVFVITLIMILQFRKYFETGVFPSFDEGMRMLCDNSILVILSFILLTPLASTPLGSTILYKLGPLTLSRPDASSGLRLNQFFLGLEENYLWVLGPTFFAISFALVDIMLWIMKLILFVSPYVIRLIKKLAISGNLSNWPLVRTIREWNSNTMQQNRRFFGSIILLIFVMIYIPYQFAYAVCCLVQAVTTIRTSIPSNQNHKEKIDLRKVSTANFNLTIMMLMIWIMPINIPVLVVFFHNVAVRWETPFTSHHNILAILPIILLVGRNVQGNCLPQTQGLLQRKITGFILSYFAFFTLIYGLRHLYWLHYLLNIFAAWLFILSFPSRSS
jgi:glycosylphosphatidylinositol deacylase